MSLSVFCQTQSQLARLFCAVLFCIGCFNFSLIAEPISIFFQISSFTGKVIVNKFWTICNWILELIRLIYLFLQVFYEDSLIFLKDATDKFAFVIFLLQKLYLFLENFGWKITEGFLRLGEFIWNILAFVYYTLVTVKEGIKFLGLSIWNFSTCVPEILILKANDFAELFINTRNEFRNLFVKVQEKLFECLEKTYLLLFDIPLDSVYGLIIGLCFLIILYVKFKSICKFMVNVVFKLYQQFIIFGAFLWSGRFLDPKSKRNTDINFEDNEIVCIICQNKLKEIILFPCKHLCLCGDCSLRLTSSQQHCPICRSDITGTLKVYL